MKYEKCAPFVRHTPRSYFNIVIAIETENESCVAFQPLRCLRVGLVACVFTPDTFGRATRIRTFCAAQNVEGIGPGTAETSKTERGKEPNSDQHSVRCDTKQMLHRSPDALSLNYLRRWFIEKQTKRMNGRVDAIPFFQFFFSLHVSSLHESSAGVEWRKLSLYLPAQFAIRSSHINAPNQRTVHVADDEKRREEWCCGRAKTVPYVIFKFEERRDTTTTTTKMKMRAIPKPKWIIHFIAVFIALWEWYSWIDGVDVVWECIPCALVTLPTGAWHGVCVCQCDAVAYARKCASRNFNIFFILLMVRARHLATISGELTVNDLAHECHSMGQPKWLFSF